MACAAGGVTVLVLWKFIPGASGDWSMCKLINGCLAGNNFLLVYGLNYIIDLYYTYSLLHNSLIKMANFSLASRVNDGYDKCLKFYIREALL